MSNVGFVREDRYLVMKRSEIESGLDAEQKAILFHLAQKIAAERHSLGKPVLECVVVEKDWPNYEDVWKSVIDVANGNFRASESIETLSSENAKLREMLERIVSYAEINGDYLLPFSVDEIKEQLLNGEPQS